MNPKDQLVEIEKEIEDKKKRWLEHYQKCRNCKPDDYCGMERLLHYKLTKLLTAKKYFLLGNISQLKIRLEELEPYVDFMDVSNEDNTKTSEIKLKLIKEGYDKIDKISADLKFYEDKLKEMGE